MNNTITIAWKETKAYFTSPTAYIVGAMFLVLTGIFFVFDMTRPFAEASVRNFVSWANLFIMFVAPLLTMRLLAEEQKMGTLELLLTAPVRDWEVVLGKYIASFFALMVTLAFTLYYVILLYVFATPDTGPILSAYFGLVLYGTASLAIGIMASSLVGQSDCGGSGWDRPASDAVVYRQDFRHSGGRCLRCVDWHLDERPFYRLRAGRCRYEPYRLLREHGGGVPFHSCKVIRNAQVAVNGR